MYLGLENGDAVQAIDTLTNQIIATIPVGQSPQALVYAPNATTSDDGTADLKPLGPATEALHIDLVPPEASNSTAHASVSVNSLGLIDNLQIAATGLEPGKSYELLLVISGSQKVMAMKLEVRSNESGDLILRQASPPTNSAELEAWGSGAVKPYRTPYSSS